MTTYYKNYKVRKNIGARYVAFLKFTVTCLNYVSFLCWMIINFREDFDYTISKKKVEDLACPAKVHSYFPSHLDQHL